MFEYKDTFDPLNKNTSLTEKLCFIHSMVKQHVKFITRISIAIYEPKTELLKTYVESSGDIESLRLYQAKLSEVPSFTGNTGSGESQNYK